MTQKASRLAILFGVILWLGMAGYRAWDYHQFRTQRQAQAKAFADEEARLRALLEERSRVVAPGADPMWQGHEKMEIVLEKNRIDRLPTSGDK